MEKKAGRLTKNIVIISCAVRNISINKPWTVETPAVFFISV